MWALAGTAHAGEPPARIVFPVVGHVAYEDDFGDPRGQGRHEGNDILAERRAPAVAAEPGKVRFWTTSRSAGCMLYLHGNSGTTYLYIHLNNDLTDGNDNRGSCVAGVAYAPGLRDGQKVRAGQLLGFVGDSGDADGIHPHLHFELHPGGGGAVSPYPWLQKARRLLFPALAPDDVTLALYGTVRPSEAGQLCLRVERVRASNGWRGAVKRTVVLTIAADARIERTVDGRRRAVVLDGLEAGERATVWTAAVAQTLEAQVAGPGVLAATQVLLGGPAP